MNLTTMTMNALRNCASQNCGWRPDDAATWNAGPPKSLIASIHYDVIKETYGLGKLGLSDVVKWLAQDGLVMPGTPDGTKRSNVSQSRLDAAADLLRRHGYKVELTDGKDA